MPAHVSLFTGHYPNRTGVRKNGCHYYDGRYPTLAEVLQDKNYYTHAIISSIILEKQFGLDRGFTTYDDDFNGKKRRKKWFGKRFWVRRAKETTDLALKAMRRHKYGPSFYWIHYFDCHIPYHRNYNNECRYMDEHLGRLLAKINLKKTIVIIVADHGEGLGEHKERYHGTKLFNTTVNVPLLIYPKINGRLDYSYSITDIMPTILSILDMKYPLHYDEENITFHEVINTRSIFIETLHKNPLYACIFKNIKYISNEKLYERWNDNLIVAGVDYKEIISEKQKQIKKYKENALPIIKINVDQVIVDRLKNLGYME